MLRIKKLPVYLLVGTVASYQVGQPVNTSSGLVQGHPAALATDVSEYLGIPFAKPPIGDLRFAAPEPYVGNGNINASNFSVSCPALRPPPPVNLSSQPYIFAPNGVEIIAGESQWNDVFGEDCLTLNVWTKPQTGEDKKAVMVWIFGGGFQTGSSNIPGTNGARLAGEEDVVLVSFNYRTNIFGFPGNPAGKKNVGLLDQRLAIEWVRDNIEAFGGDPGRITIFGQSAGGISVDYYSFAWVSDPIVQGFIQESGNAFSFPPSSAAAATKNWFNVSALLGCGGFDTDPSSVVNCMRSKNYTDILAAVTQITSTSADASTLGSFAPTVDDEVVFEDYGQRAQSGQFIQRPLLIGHTDYEAGYQKAALALNPVANETGLLSPSLEFYWDVFNDIAFDCSAARRAFISYTANIPTWRYRWFGNFPNMRLTIVPDSGAYHGSELPFVFNSLDGLGPSTAAEISMGGYVRGAWASFAKDPSAGLLTHRDWLPYEPAGQTLLRLAFDNVTGPNYGCSADYDYRCPFLGAVSGANGVSVSAVSGGLFPVYQILTNQTKEDFDRLLCMYQA